MDYQLTTPIIFLIFNRPDTTLKVFEAIREAKPTKLLVIADGARNDSEASLCHQARAITEAVDWNCEVLRNYAEENLGCRKRVSSGLDWAFSEVEEAIILEDDCLPRLEFFHFCSELLEYYRFDEKIWSICGNNFLENKTPQLDSYYFSKYPDPWGWATWKRAWKNCDHNLLTWPSSKKNKEMYAIFSPSFETLYWTYIFDRLYDQKKPDTWDYAWIFSCLISRGYSVRSRINLISNIGFGANATHTKESNSPLANRATLPLGEIQHPLHVCIDAELDSQLFDVRFKKALGKKDILKIYFTKFAMTILKYFKQIIPKSLITFFFHSFNIIKQNILTTCGRLIRPFKPELVIQNIKNPVYLHLGCGEYNLPGYINIDALSYPHIHYVRAIDDLSIFENNSIDLIYASHCLEHFPYSQVPHVLSEWYRVLKIGGILRLSVPDFDLLLKIYTENGNNLENIVMPLMGEQDYKYNYHMTVFNYLYLEKFLLKVGFQSVQKWKPYTSKETSLSDWSSRSIKINQKEYFVSLNVEAIK